MPDPSDLAVAHRAANRGEAEIVRLVLEDAGLIAVIPDRHAPYPTDLRPLDDEFVLAGCEVLVPARDLDRAREALAEAREAGRLGPEGDEAGGPPP